METKTIDLHVHSTCSDGTFTPSELAAEAQKAGLCALALTDHDCILGIKEAKAAALNRSVEIIPGVELSCTYLEKEIHLLGLYINEDSTSLQTALDAFCVSRDSRNRQMIDLLRTKAGFAITYEELQRAYPDSVLTRAHIARFLAAHGYVKDISTVFRKYIGDNCPYFVSRPKVTPEEGISLIHEAGGLAFLAHPVLYHMSTVSMDTLVGALTDAGLDGIEAVYSTYQPSEEQNMKKLALQYNLLISGGSDFHGSSKPHIKLGYGTKHMPIPGHILSDIKYARLAGI